MTRLLLAALAALCLATPALAEMDGPFVVVDRTACTTTQADPPVTTCPPVPGQHYIVSPAFYAAHADVLSPYRDAAQTDLQATYAGDSPEHPTMTVALTFPDAATAQAVKAALGLTAP